MHQQLLTTVNLNAVQQADNISGFYKVSFALMDPQEASEGRHPDPGSAGTLGNVDLTDG